MHFYADTGACTAPSMHFYADTAACTAPSFHYVIYIYTINTTNTINGRSNYFTYWLQPKLTKKDTKRHKHQYLQCTMLEIPTDQHVINSPTDPTICPEPASGGHFVEAFFVSSVFVSFKRTLKTICPDPGSCGHFVQALFKSSLLVSLREHWKRYVRTQGPADISLKHLLNHLSLFPLRKH